MADFLAEGAASGGVTISPLSWVPATNRLTPGYMSPEQARALAVDARTDIWSLGVVLYEMVAGRRPFEGETASDVIASILQKEPASLARYASEVPEALEWIVTKTLAKDKEERYGTAKELLADLKKLKRRLEFETEAGQSAPPASGGATPSSWGGRAMPHSTARKTVPLTAETPRTASSAEYQLQYLGTDPAFDDLRADQRFADLLRRIGLP